ncbi:lipopolysaccharide biosynthesis protein [Streptomyces zhihengii]|uniref:lipopolysaccharide biosynthesis protein n=1 Tax=Streptomyces zhihengii TaxID=1818004 RepID=UPI0033A50E36
MKLEAPARPASAPRRWRAAALARSTTRPAGPGRIADIRRDPLMSNSFFLMLTTVTAAAAGFLFWILVAHLYPAEEVGRASSLISCVYLLSYFSLFGLSNTLVRHLPTSERPGDETSTAVVTACFGTLLVSGTFVLAVPWLAPQLAFVHSSPLTVVVFLVLAGGAAVNLLTDSVFVAFRSTRYNFAINGVLMGSLKVALPVAFVFAGAMGIFLASGLASAVAAAVSIWVARRKLRLRVRPYFSWRLLRRTIAYSLSNYVACSLNLVPQIVLPLVVLERLGPVPAAVFFIAFQIANLVYCASYAIGDALFAEGSQAKADLRSIARRSGAAMLAVNVPAAAFVMLLAGHILNVFGPEYARGGTTTLLVFALSALGVAFYTWADFLLKVTRQLTASVASNLVAFAVILGITLAKVDEGLVWAAIAWGIGNVASGVVATAALLLSRRGPLAARRRSRKEAS